jgi:cysteine desulfurase/selenocysteine lyase
MPMDLNRLRADTPACEQVIHFNNAGASLQPRPVTEAVAAHLAREQEIGGYEAEAEAVDALASFYTGFADMLGANPSEIAYVENATRAWDMAFYGLPLTEGDHILTHKSEYASNYLALLQQARRRGLHVDLVPSDATGQIDVEILERMVSPRTRLIALTHVPTQGGLVNPAEAVGRVAREYGLIYMLDACQSVGQMPVDVREIGCHVLSGTGRKFLRGPRGTGFLYVSNDIVDQIEPPFIDLRAAEWTGADSYELAEGARRFENWESYVAGRIGLARAVAYATEIGLAEIEERISTLASALRMRLADLPGVSVHDQGERLCGIVTFRVEGEAPADTAVRLAQKRINVSVSQRTSAQLDLGARGLNALTRASVHYFNSENELERFVEAVGRVR